MIPDSVTSIDRGVFEDCVSLRTITIPGSVNSIDHMTFKGCNNLVSITSPDSVTSIGWGAFKGCSNYTIHAHSGSYAEEYAKENDIPFKPLDE